MEAELLQRSILAQSRFFPGWVWEEKIEVLGDDGLTTFTYKLYGYVRLVFLPGPRRQQRESTGSWNKEFDEVIIPYQEIKQFNLTPNTATSFLRKDGVRYRVVDIEDQYVPFPHNECYNLRIERVEV